MKQNSISVVRRQNHFTCRSLNTGYKTTWASNIQWRPAPSSILSVLQETTSLSRTRGKKFIKETD